ncbi:hypothetical protein ACFV16_22575 [Streptomyces massasporeus]|uniref:hypothetical protein n=1 Tax=Streptomyces massasporeus TaxID=67324 RepID=UPI00368BA376
MAATSTLTSRVTSAARRAADIYNTWTADPEMPAVAGSMADAVRVLALRAAVFEQTGDAVAAALPAPAAVELSGRLMDSQFPELRRVVERTCHRFISARPGTRWQPGGYAHQVYTEAFGAASGRHWSV